MLREPGAAGRRRGGAPIAVQAKLVQMAKREKTATAAPSTGPPVRSRCASGSPAGAGTASVAALNARNIASGTAEPAARARGGGRAGTVAERARPQPATRWPAARSLAAAWRAPVAAGRARAGRMGRAPASTARVMRGRSPSSRRQMTGTRSWYTCRGGARSGAARARALAPPIGRRGAARAPATGTRR